ncbi:MAG: pyridoxamine 5'-phosphate oxidase family protein [Nitrososphaerales archaeon]
MVSFEARIRAIIEESRVARLVTVDVDDNNIPQPYLVPTVFVFDGKHFFIPFDKKSKKVSIEKSRRLKNIQKNPNVVILIDEYSDDWSKLFFVMIRGSAKIIEEEEKKLLVRAHKLLLLKYPQYKNVGIGRSCIMIDPRKVIFWRNS